MGTLKPSIISLCAISPHFTPVSPLFCPLFCSLFCPCFAPCVVPLPHAPQCGGDLTWWLIRVTLVVDWLFLAQNFGHVVGTYEGLLRLSECTWGGGSIFRWWGHLTTICTNQTFFLPQVVGTLKPSIISLCAVSPCFAPCVLPLVLPLFCPLFCPLFHPLCCSLTSCPSWWWGPYLVAH